MTLIPTDGIQVCLKCGILNHVLIESDKPSFKDPPPEISYFAYKRINHFNEFERLRAKYIMYLKLTTKKCIFIHLIFNE